MKSERTPGEASAAALVTFALFDSKSERIEVTFAVSGNLLWSGAGLAKLYEASRASYLGGPETEGFDEDIWESWHLLRAEGSPEQTIFVFNIEDPYAEPG